MKNHLITSALYTVASTILVGIIYPVMITGVAQFAFKAKANGQLITGNGVVVGSRILAQPFSSPKYFHPRPSAAGVNGYDASNSGGSNYGPTNHKLIERVEADRAALQAQSRPSSVPVDLVTTSGSGLDPDITPAAAEFQIARVAKARGISVEDVRIMVREHTEGRRFGFLGEARVNVLQLNLALDEKFPQR